jgi:hypothetical protein
MEVTESESEERCLEEKLVEKMAMVTPHGTDS